ncbi:hypothetical protein [Legionella cardiaca]|uniref:Uncharacterized protein n=1 Tax=Legionella cardiaca TaxID=1071983 RepID=A0ABY8AQJ3_9GAMM|nr:hypothetical protein [Legionella cardiaca]WED42964.1 hypothetical protein PXX05_13845 [Legionella cardiaca]
MFRVIKKEIKTRNLEGFYLKKSEKTKFGGAGEGGVYRDKRSGKDYLLKRVSLPGVTDPAEKKTINWRSWDEILAARFLKAAGVLVPNMFAVVDKDGVVYVASAMLPGVKNCTHDKLQTLPQASRDAILASQLLHCWLGNRDIVNGAGENFVVDADARIFNVDLGAALFSGFRSIVPGKDNVNFNKDNIRPFLIDRQNDQFGILKTKTGSSVETKNIKQTKAFFSELTSSPENERKYQLQGALMLAQFSDKDIEDLVNSTGHSPEDKEQRIEILKARKTAILEHIQKKYGEHALKEEQISLELQHIFHKYGLYNKYVGTGGSDAIVSYRAQYTNAIKPHVKINPDGTIAIQIPNGHHDKALPIIARLAGTKIIDNKGSITVTLPCDDFTHEIHKELIQNSLQVFFSSFGYLSNIQDEFHRYVYKGDGCYGFRPAVTANGETITITLPDENADKHQAMLTLFSEQLNLDPLAMRIENGALSITGINLEQLASYFMQNKGARKTAVVSENQEGKILAGKLDPKKKAVSGFATAGGGSDHPYNPVRAAREEGTDEFGHSIMMEAPLIPIGSTLPNKKKNIFLVQPGGTADKADTQIDYKEFQDNSIKYYSFREFREAYEKDQSKFDRSSVDLYLRHYQREIQKALTELGLNNVLVQISKKPATLGKISLKPSIENYNYGSNTPRKLNDECIKLMKELVGEGQFKLIRKTSEQGNSKKSMKVERIYFALADDMNPATFHALLLKKIQRVNSETSTPLEDSQQIHPMESLRKTLIDKVDNYLTWRNDKDSDDGRGYQLGLFTRLRHYTKFGQERAEKLRAQLVNEEPDKLIPILQKHFANHSTLHNHSLDTYLLEGVMKHHELLHLSDDFDLQNSSERVVLREVIKNYEVIEDSRLTGGLTTGK